MTAIEVDQIARPEIKRDKKGRYVLPTDDGKIRSHTRATTVAETIDDQYNLTLWKQRMAIYGLSQRPDQLAMASVHHPDEDKKTYNGIVAECMNAAASKAKADMGTALHRATEDVDRGKPISEMPEQFHERLTEYRRALDDAGIEIDPGGIERITILDNYRLAGTGDRIPLILPDGRRLVGDLKTGSLGDYSWLSISIQLAIYANHTATYDPVKERRGPRIDVDRTEAVVIHLPAAGGPCQLHIIDIAAGWDYFLTALDVRDHRNTSRKAARPYKPVEVGTGGATAIRDWVATRITNIEAAGGIGDLINRWPDIVPKPLPAELTGDQLDALSAALSAVEGIHQIPFGPDRPGVEPTTQQTKE